MNTGIEIAWLTAVGSPEVAPSPAALDFENTCGKWHTRRGVMCKEYTKMGNARKLTKAGEKPGRDNGDTLQEDDTNKQKDYRKE